MQHSFSCVVEYTALNGLRNLCKSEAHRKITRGVSHSACNSFEEHISKSLSFRMRNNKAKTVMLLVVVMQY